MAASRWNSVQAASGGQDNRIIPEFLSRTGLAPSLAQPPPHARSHILGQAAGCGRAALLRGPSPHQIVSWPRTQADAHPARAATILDGPELHIFKAVVGL